LSDLYLVGEAITGGDAGADRVAPGTDDAATSAAADGEAPLGADGAAPEPGNDAASDDARVSPGDASSPPADSGTTMTGDSGLPPPPACVATAGPSLVKLDLFCIDSTEVSNDQYSAFLAASPALTLAPSPACSYKTSFAPSSAIPSGKGSEPVVWVDWCDAYAFCGWAGKHLCGALQGGSSSEANAANPAVDEWYVACSMSGTYVYPYASNTYVQGKCNDSEAKTNSLRDVGTFPGCVGGYPGIFDMNGNAYEWEDACAVSVGASDACLIRGGAFDFSGTGYGGCNTYFNDYTVERSDSYNDTGFRCCDN
jgi:formylglycine-generating enzyme required for sulfatase activity